MSILRKAWERWKVIGAVVGNYHGRAITLLFYFTVMVPFGVGVSLFSDPLRIKDRYTESTWVKRERISTDVEDARRQF
ncbi:MAG: hypothetical protein JXB47_09365 [Anaerolineae bacterium]|nr:hypothetical protein [Anaerolineae bacterium]